MSLRKCCDCKIEKDLETAFSKNKYMAKGREYYCKECRKKRRQKWLETGDNKEKKLAQVREYKRTPEFRAKRNKKGLTIQQRMISNLRSRTRKCFLGYYKDKTTKALLGCTLEELTTHLSVQLTEGMTLENYGEWHIDHIVPLSSAKTKSELEKLCHYTNLQPLWAKDNLSKGSHA